MGRGGRSPVSSSYRTGTRTTETVSLTTHTPMDTLTHRLTHPFTHSHTHKHTHTLLQTNTHTDTLLQTHTQTKHTLTDKPHTYIDVLSHTQKGLGLQSSVCVFHIKGGWLRSNAGLLCCPVKQKLLVKIYTVAAFYDLAYNTTCFFL